MEVVCPNCKFRGNIGDERIPDGGRKVTCPRCNTEFFVEKKRPGQPQRDKGERLISNPPRGSYGQQELKPDEGSRKRSPILVCSVLLVTAAFFYILGFISGFALSEADSGSEVGVSKPLDKAGDKTEPGPPTVKEEESTEVPYSEEEEGSPAEVPLNTEGGVEAKKLMASLLPLSKIQAEKFVEDNLYLKVYDEGTVVDVQEISSYWKSYAKKDYADNKYGVEVEIDSYKEKVRIALEMKDSEVMKINKGDIVRFSGKFVNFTNIGSGSGIIYLDDGKLKKK
jgi:predicted Zn finger-like uncharacterized protein